MTLSNYDTFQLWPFPNLTLSDTHLDMFNNSDHGLDWRYGLRVSYMKAGYYLGATKVKEAAPLCNLSVWEPRFGSGVMWGLEA